MGWTYNTVNPDAPTIGPGITITAAVLTALSLLVVCLRLYVRLGIIKATGIGMFFFVPPSFFPLLFSPLLFPPSFPPLSLCGIIPTHA